MHVSLFVQQLKVMFFFSVPLNAPSLLKSTQDTSTEPFQLTFSWKYPISDHTDAPILGGFILHCYHNVTNSSTEELYSHSYFTYQNTAPDEHYTMQLTQYISCDSQISSYMCDIRAFNEKGEGPRSAPTIIYLPCNQGSEMIKAQSPF